MTASKATAASELPRMDLGALAYLLHSAECLADQASTSDEVARQVGIGNAVLAELRRREERERMVREAAKEVCWFDWSDNDQDAVEAVESLRAALAAYKEPNDGR